MITDEDLASIEVAASAASQAQWHTGVTPADREAARKWMTDCFDAGDGSQGHMVVVPDGYKPLDETALVVAFTGNGPTSEANARFIATMSPSNTLLLVDEIRRLRKELRRRAGSNA